MDEGQRARSDTNHCFSLASPLQMERSTTKPSHRRGGPSNPSFSSSLLDAICRAIDESDGTTEPLSLSLTPKPLSPDPSLYPAAVPSPVLLRRNNDTADLHPHRRRQFATSSFSSADADSSRPRRIRTAPPPPPPRPKSEPNSIRIRDQEARSRPSPASPGSRLASFVAGLFAGPGGTRKKAKISSGVCSPASSLAGSCFSRTPPSSSGGGKRFDGGDAAAAAAARAREGRRMVAELMRGLEDMMDDGGESDDDLFELQDLGELPVYHTTRRAIAL